MGKGGRASAQVNIISVISKIKINIDFYFFSLLISFLIISFLLDSKSKKEVVMKAEELKGMKNNSNNVEKLR
tara:strand:- start:915 stop:1130 length:216 start_codon:yes stop_codon:yes gene_type:complete